MGAAQDKETAVFCNVLVKLTLYHLKIKDRFIDKIVYFYLFLRPKQYQYLKKELKK